MVGCRSECNHRQFNTALGAGALLANTANQNTAVGVGALLSNFTGADNTANGALALFSNITGTGNTAMGLNALFSNNTADSNTAVGWNALALNTTGTGNTAFGVNALVANVTGTQNTGIGLGALFSTTGDNNSALGFGAGADLTGDSNIDIGVQVRGLAGENNTIRIGDNLPQGGQSNCHIGGIRDGVINLNDSLIVAVDPAGKLGTPAFAQKLRFRDVIEDHKKIEQLEAIVAALAGQLKEQAAQVQKMSAQLAAASPFRGGLEASTCTASG